MTTLSDGTTTVTLPNSMEWIDEHSWSPVAQQIQPTFGGGLVVSENAVIAGRPITLAGGPNVWVTKTTLDALKTLVNVAGVALTLTLPDARTFQVVVNRSSSGGLVAKPVWRKNIYTGDDNFTLTLNLTEI